MIKAVILAAGFGTRLGELTEDTPKPMIDVKGEPIIDYVIYNLKQNGIKDIAVNLHHLGYRIKAHLGDSVKYFEELHHPLGTAGALFPMQGWLSDTFIVCNGDTITNVNIREMLGEHLIKENDITVFTKRDEIHSGGTYIMNKNILKVVRDGMSIHENLIPLAKDFGWKVGTFDKSDAFYYDCGTPEKLNSARRMIEVRRFEGSMNWGK